LKDVDIQTVRKLSGAASRAGQYCPHGGLRWRMPMRVCIAPFFKVASRARGLRWRTKGKISNLGGTDVASRARGLRLSLFLL